MTMVKKVFTIELTAQEVSLVADALSDSCKSMQVDMDKLEKKSQDNDQDRDKYQRLLSNLKTNYKDKVALMKSIGGLVGTSYWGY